MNLVLASGNLTRDPEMRYTPGGKAVTVFAIAVNEGSGENKTTEYLDCQVWEKQAELVAEYCRKGSKVLVQGRYTTDNWVDKTTEQKRKKVIINCQRVEFLSPRSDAPRSNVEVENDLKELAF